MNDNLISEDYKKSVKQLHAESEGRWANSGTKHLPMMEHYLPRFIKDRPLFDADKPFSLLDYGAGGGNLGRGLRNSNFSTRLFEYDPCVEGKDSDPPNCVVVCCFDVLEHVEESKLDNVLKHINSKVNDDGAFVGFVATGLAYATLEDGRNAHITCKPNSWWVEKLSQHFAVKLVEHMSRGIFFIAKRIPLPLEGYKRPNPWKEEEELAKHDKDWISYLHERVEERKKRKEGKE